MSARAKWMTVGTIGWIVGMAFAGVASAQAPPALLPEPDGVPKNRFISFSFPQAQEGTQWAVRLTLVKMYNTDPADEDNEACPPRPTGCAPDGVCNLDRRIECSFDSDCPPPLSSFEGEVRWVGQPKSCAESAGNRDPYRWICAALECCPDFRDWAGELEVLRAPRCIGRCDYSVDLIDCTEDEECPPPILDATVVHTFGAEIVPCSQYEVQLVDVNCPDLTDESCYSDPLTIHSAKWGDVWAPLGGESQPNFTDIGKVVEKFKALMPPAKVQVLLRWNVPPVGDSVTFSDIGRVVNAFKRISYREAGPSACVEACE